MNDHSAPEKKPTPSSVLEVRPIGRPTVLESLDLTVDDLVTAYKEAGTLKLTAERTGICVNTLKKYLGAAGALGPRGARPQPFAWRRTRTSPVGEWFKEHRNDKLPRTMRDLAALSGFSENQVRKFLATRQRAAIEYLRALGDLREVPKAIVDVSGRRVPCGMIQEYVLKVDRYDLSVRIEGALRLGLALKAIVPFGAYQGMFK